MGSDGNGENYQIQGCHKVVEMRLPLQIHHRAGVRNSMLMLEIFGEYITDDPHQHCNEIYTHHPHECESNVLRLNCAV